MKVKDLKNALKDFEPEAPICIHIHDGNGSRMKELDLPKFNPNKSRMILTHGKDWLNYNPIMRGKISIMGKRLIIYIPQIYHSCFKGKDVVEISRVDL